MAQYTIDIPERIRGDVESRASASGHSSVEAYVQSLVVQAVSEDEDEEVDYGAPPAVSFSSVEELENMLKNRLKDDPSNDIELDEAFFDRLRDRALHGPTKPGTP